MGRHEVNELARGGGETGRGDALCPDEKDGESLECGWAPLGEFTPLHNAELLLVTS